MATSSFTSHVTINRKTAASLSRIMSKESKPNTKGAKKVDKINKKQIKDLKFK